MCTEQIPNLGATGSNPVGDANLSMIINTCILSKLKHNIGGGLCDPLDGFGFLMACLRQSRLCLLW